MLKKIPTLTYILITKLKIMNKLKQIFTKLNIFTTISMLFFILTLTSFIMVWYGIKTEFVISQVAFPIMFYSTFNLLSFIYLNKNIKNIKQRIIVIITTVIDVFIFVGLLIASGYYLYIGEKELFTYLYLGLMISFIPLIPAFMILSHKNKEEKQYTQLNS